MARLAACGLLIFLATLSTAWAQGPSVTVADPYLELRTGPGRGFSVFLAEMNDLASGTSSTSTKLIHGGLRYLETYDFKLVRKALKERRMLLEVAPHRVWPFPVLLRS